MAQDAIMTGWNAIGGAVDEFVKTGKFKFKDFARSVIQDLLAMIIKAQIFKAIQGTMGMFGFSLPGLAEGGPAKANQPYIVGERGPELFVPKSAGTVIPNDQLMNNNSNAPITASAPVTNNYITNNISAIDSKSVAQLFAENRKTLLGTVQMAQREMPY
jgi:phage-related minor tail protein